MAEETNAKSDILMHKLETVKVVVFLDRAEVTRQLSTKIGKGENEIVIKELSEYLDSESLRVEGKGHGSIVDVIVKTDRTCLEKVEEEKRNEADIKKAELENELKELTQKIAYLEKSAQTLQSQKNVLENFGKNIPEKDKNFNEEFVTSFVSFVNSYGTSMEKISTGILDTNREIEECREKERKLREKISNLFHKVTKTKTRQLSIYVDGAAEGDIEIMISYVVMNASWKPKYDIRVSSIDQTLKIHYYGLIKQTTEEDWNACQVFLSSATPSIGGNLPKLGNFQLSLKPKFVPYEERTKSKGLPPPARMMMTSVALKKSRSRASYASHDTSEILEMCEESAEVNEYLTSTTFEVSKPATIPSDQVEHKVCIAVLDLQAQFQYKTVPRKAAHAYLIAKVTNNSDYAFFPGKGNIFFDNNFVAKTDFKAVSPKEEFSCDLGRDLSVRIDFKPEQKFKERTGWVHRSTMTTYSQNIVVKNTKAFPIHITVIDRVPQSVDDEIKVNLIEPCGLKLGPQEKVDYSKPIRINKQNNIEWEFDLGSGKEKACLLKYSIEHPASKQIDTIEIYDNE
ncbi:DgyrCDS6095 [Dimorphilus gyrociliatus]|uniref:DgyrCDS6095 n=1 Tax=Dimorphilus gyrociliatus TaxID=2664684 RepID=A0A7I8VNK0_9ANNE|nr:DgyrCDS6095 [Dimorphilus gyrociliatus]